MKQKYVYNYIHKLTSGIICLLETKVKPMNLGSLYQRVFKNWCFTTNSCYHPGGRIILAWKSGSFHLNVLFATSQMIHCLIQPVHGNQGFHCTFIYGFNERERREKFYGNT